MVTTSERKAAQQKQISEAITKYRGGELSQKEASTQVKRIYRGGGGGAAADPRKFEAAQLAEQKAKQLAEQKTKEEARKKATIEAASIAAQRTQQALRAQASQRQKTIIRTRTGKGVSVTTPGEESTYQRTATYHGQAIVPGTGGLTAQQYKRKLEAEFRKQEGTKPGERVRISTTQEILSGVTKEVKEEKTIMGPVQPTTYERQTYSMMNVPAPDRKGYTYDPRSGMYVKPTYGLGAGGTAIMDPPTIKEAEKIKAAEYAGSIAGITEMGKAGLKWYEETVVVPLSKTKGFKGYQKYVVEPLSEKIVQPTGKGVKAGLKLYEEKVVRQIRTAMPSLGETQVGQIAQAKRIIESKAPEEVIRIGLPGQVRAVPAGKFQDRGLIGFGKEVYLGEVEKAWTDVSKTAGVKKPGYVGKAARITSEFGAYAVPGYFGAEIGAEATEAALGGRFGGPSSVVEFVKERPIEVAIAGTLGVAGGIKFFGKTAKQARKIKKYGKYLDEPTERVVALETRITKEVVKPKIVKPKIKYSMIDGSRTKKGDKKRNRKNIQRNCRDRTKGSIQRSNKIWRRHNKSN